jgi:hypothetical protein
VPNSSGCALIGALRATEGPGIPVRLDSLAEWHLVAVSDIQDAPAHAMQQPSCHADLKLTYHGQFDDARPGNGKKVTGRDLRAALDATLAGEKPHQTTPSIGCDIKWHL